MNQEKLTGKQFILVSLFIFGMFFGAGNLIFPIQLGEVFREEWFSGLIGLLLSACLIPYLGLIALAQTKSVSIYNFAQPLGRRFALFFMVLIHLSLSLLIATPRTAALSYQFSFGYLLQDSPYDRLGLVIFVALYFLLCYYLSLNPKKMMNIVGKILSPLLVALIILVVAMQAVKPIGTIPPARPSQINGDALAHGFVQGYGTMDAIAALAFGVAIFNALHRLGMDLDHGFPKALAKTSALSWVLIALIYIAFVLLGTATAAEYGPAENGGLAIMQLVHFYFGNPGLVIIACIAFFADMTTALSLMSAFAEDFSTQLPVLSYKGWLRVSALVSFLVATVGLDQIIAWAVPLLSFMYPLALALILPALFSPRFGYDPLVYKGSVALSIIPAIFEGLATLPVQPEAIRKITKVYQSFMPLAKLGMSWLLPALIGMTIGWIQHRRKNKGKDFSQLTRSPEPISSPSQEGSQTH